MMTRFRKHSTDINLFAGSGTALIGIYYWGKLTPTKLPFEGP